ncbi:hypothetical protein EKN56_17745 [Limnobaculum zhutongyuii]|uniref:Two-component system QseEF-associated lipoprotein QseG n=1 Tax=Limnobaculum zhutongyuii TaxID=2498113 RepID=A0A411WPA7_9GAMM|nr:hypothetical protein [Limnobaculum zhutongyuii]QBH98074.1 hypothetical protein EKN56_17745 [Limnobaculum zhutongyuii]TQS88068.1 hypothetical protein ELQ32_11120 [Limnobaculum zhutongyuii]
MPKRFTKQDLNYHSTLSPLNSLGVTGRWQKALTLSAFMLPVMLAGCSYQSFTESASGEIRYETPNRKVSDYSRVSCDGNIWKAQDSETYANSLYWLRLITCSQSLPASRAQAQSGEYETTTWDGVMKRAVLLSRVEVNNSERRRSLEQLKNFRSMYPDTVYSLIQLWTDEQSMELSLSDERVRHQRQKESNDTQMDALHAQLQDTKHQLNEMTRKLENLTDIERQLSSRKNLPADSTIGSAAKTEPAPVVIPTPPVVPEKPAGTTQPASAAQKIAPDAKPAAGEKAVEPAKSTPEVKSTPEAKPTVGDKPAEPVKAVAPAVDKPVTPQNKTEKESAKPAQPPATTAPAKADTPAVEKK